MIGILDVRAVAHQSPVLHEFAPLVDGWKTMLRRERDHLRDELLAEADGGRDLAIGLGLRQVVDGAELEAPERDLGVALGQGRDHDHRQARPPLEQERQRADAVELRHVEVEKHDLRLDPLQGLARVERGHGGRRDLHSFPARRPSDLEERVQRPGVSRGGAR